MTLFENTKAYRDLASFSPAHPHAHTTVSCLCLQMLVCVPRRTHLDSRAASFTAAQNRFTGSSFELG
eukprot:COSAG06_NODE_33206_length_493_cov_1.370558_1_plen_66_part_01